MKSKILPSESECFDISLNKGGIYVHIPFCKSRCGYCSFFTAGLRRAQWPDFTAALLNELNERVHEIPSVVQSVYFGGGTPSALPGDVFSILLERIADIVKEAGLEFSPQEITVEANPDDISSELADIWRESGVNRVSLGVQSFNGEMLKILNRLHNPAHVEKAIHILGKRFANISIDLIFGIPGQTLEEWNSDLDKALEAGIKHLSAYSLSYEERSLLTFKRDKGFLKEALDIDTESMYLALLDKTHAAGLRHYEVSNFAMPGFESVHNSSYWKGLPYIGIGPSASSYDGMRKRTVNGSMLSEWYTNAESEELTDEDLRTEYILTRLRRAEGINLEDMSFRLGRRIAEHTYSLAKPLLREGYLIEVDNCLQVSRKGWIIHDSLCLKLIE